MRVEAGGAGGSQEAVGSPATGDGSSVAPRGADAAAAAPDDIGATAEPNTTAEASEATAEDEADPFAAALAIDLHADVVLQVAEHDRDFLADDGEWTIDRARRGGLDAQIFPLWISPRRDDQEAALKRAERAFREMIDGSGGALAVVRTAGELRERSAAGLLSALLGIEGALPLGDDPANLDPLVAMGLCYLGLTWNNSNAFGEAAADLREPHGLTELGRRLVARANDAGVLLDLSHASAATFWDVHRISRSPLLVSHAGLRALRDIPRNIDDLQVLALMRSGGVFGVVWHSGFLTDLPEGETVAPLSALLDAYDHAKALGAVASLALGSDLDGGIHPPAELATIDGLPALGLGLRERGWTDEEIAGVLGENFLRLLGEAEEEEASGTEAPSREWPAEITCGGGLATAKEAQALTDRRIVPGPVVPAGTAIMVTWEAEDGADGAVLEVWGEPGPGVLQVYGGDTPLSDTTEVPETALPLATIGLSAGGEARRLELTAEAASHGRLILVPRASRPEIRVDEIVVWRRERATEQQR